MFRIFYFQTEPVHCQVDFSGISEHVDLRFAEFKMQTHAHFVKLINAAKLDLRRGARVDSIEREHTEDKEKDIKERCSCKDETVKDSSSQETVSSRVTNLESGNRSENVTPSEDATVQASTDQTKKYQDENDERVMNALYNMTGSVLQAVSYFRNSGRILEQILSNTDSITVQQTDLARRLDISLSNGLIATEDLEPEQSNIIPGTDSRERQQTYHTLFTAARSVGEGCVLPMDMISSLANVIKNGSHLLEVSSQFVSEINFSVYGYVKN